MYIKKKRYAFFPSSHGLEEETSSLCDQWILIVRSYPVLTGAASVLFLVLMDDSVFTREQSPSWGAAMGPDFTPCTRRNTTV